MVNLPASLGENLSGSLAGDHLNRPARRRRFAGFEFAQCGILQRNDSIHHDPVQRNTLLARFIGATSIDIRPILRAIDSCITFVAGNQWTVLGRTENGNLEIANPRDARFQLADDSRRQLIANPSGNSRRNSLRRIRFDELNQSRTTDFRKIASLYCELSFGRLAGF